MSLAVYFFGRITLNPKGPTPETRFLGFQDVYQEQQATIFSKISVLKANVA